MLWLTALSASASGTQTSRIVRKLEGSVLSRFVELAEGHGRRRPAGHRTDEADADGGGGLQRVADVEVVGEGLGPVLPGVGGGIGGDVLVVGGTVEKTVVVAGHGGGVVGPFVTEAGAERLDAAGLLDEDGPVVVTDLVAEVTEQRAIGLRQVPPDLVAPEVVVLGQIDGDHAAPVTGDARCARRVDEVERQPVGLAVASRPDRAGRAHGAGR